MDERSRLDVLPNEILVYIISMIDVVSIVQFAMASPRFYAVVSDLYKWDTINWKGSSRAITQEKLKVALKLSKTSLTNLSLTFYGKPLCLSRYIHLIPACRQLSHVTLSNVRITRNHMEKILALPSLHYLCLSTAESSGYWDIFQTISCANSTLNILCLPFSEHCIDVWCGVNCVPPNLRLLVVGAIDEVYRVPSWKKSFPKQKACLSYCQPVSEYASIDFDPLFEYHIEPSSTRLGINLLQAPDSRIPPSLELAELSSGSKSVLGASLIPSSWTDMVAPKACSSIANLVSIHLCCSVRSGDSLKIAPVHLVAIAESCPRLLHLDLQGCRYCLKDLFGLNAIAVKCCALEMLNLLSVLRSYIENTSDLWEILGKMKNLAVLTIHGSILQRDSEPVMMPSLRALHVRTSGYEYKRFTFIDRDFRFLTIFPSLKYFKFRTIPFGTVFTGITNLLYTSSQLKQLYLVKEPGNKLTLPLDSSCYRNLEMLYLCCTDFIFSEELALTLSQCQHLSVLALNVSSISKESIKQLFDSLRSLTCFYIVATSENSFLTKKGSKALSLLLLKQAKAEGRVVDVLLMGRSTDPQHFADTRVEELFAY